MIPAGGATMNTRVHPAVVALALVLVAVAAIAVYWKSGTNPDRTTPPQTQAWMAEQVDAGMESLRQSETEAAEDASGDRR